MGSEGGRCNIIRESANLFVTHGVEKKMIWVVLLNTQHSFEELDIHFVRKIETPKKGSSLP